MGRAYYNDNDKFCVSWVRKLIAAGLVPDGDVDNRPIQEVQPKDLEGCTQIHLFCGIAGWALVLKLAGWPEDWPVWTGSPPCQPYSIAGKHKGDDDPRNLWSEMRRLIEACKPGVVFGEQVASKARREWLSRVGSDLINVNYDFAAANLPSSVVGAPHIRQRLWWVAELKS